MSGYTDLFRRPGQGITVEQLHKEYKAGNIRFPALNGVSCNIAEGSVTVIQGPSGCGKTTLLNILGGVDSATRGIARVGETEISAISDESTLSRYRLHDVGFIFQAFNLIPGLSMIDNLQLPMSAADMNDQQCRDRAHQLLKLVRLEGKALKKPGELSSGEQQRVAIALALANDPCLILADEPTSSLDSDNTKIVVELLRSLAHDFGKTVLVTTHDPLVGQSGDRNYFMRDGSFSE